MRSDIALRIVPQSAIVVEGVLQQVDDADVRLVRFLYCDYAGIIRTKVVHRANLERKLTEGVGVTLAQSALNVRDELIDIPEMPPVDEVRLVPDPSTFTVLPWVEAGGSVVASLLDRSREPWFGCTRSLLRRQIAAAADAGFSVEATFENEYYLYRRSAEGGDVQPERLPVYSSIGFDEYHAVLLETVDALTAQGITPELAMNEYGGGQLEISVRHAPALAAADSQIKMRDTVRGIALRHGYRASFAPKPFLDQIGSGTHVHMSLWHEGRNLLHDATAEGGLSELGRWWIGGLLEHLPALLALTCPSMNSYQRLSAVGLGRRPPLLGVRQPRGAGARRLAVLGPRGAERERRAEILRLQLEPPPGAGCHHRRRAGRHRPQDRPRRARAGQPCQAGQSPRGCPGRWPWCSTCWSTTTC